MRAQRPGRRRSISSLTPVRLAQLLAATALAIGIGGYALNSGAGAQEHDASTTTTSTTSSDQATATPNPNTYDLSALANSLDVLVTDPNLPVSSLLTIEAGPFGASASINSLGLSMSDAGAPYSPAVASLPGTVDGLGSGFIPPLPPLPGYVSANYPGTPSDQEDTGGYQITSTAAPTDAKGAVAIGVQPAGSGNATMFASAESEANGDGSVKVDASAGLDALSFGQLFDLANVSSSVSLTQQANGQPTITSQTNLGTITLLGQASGLQSDGLDLLGVDVPIDINRQLIGTLNSVLSPLGISLTYLPETVTYTDGSTSTGSTIDTAKTLQAIDSGALRITVTESLASQGQITFTFTVGRVYVSTTDTPGFSSVPTDLGAGGSLGAVSSNPFDESGTGLAGTLPPAVAGPTGSPPARSSTSLPRALAVQPTYVLDKGPPAESLYLMLILVALATLLASQAVRLLAVRLAMGTHRGS